MSEKNEFEITRTFNAPRNLIWRTFTEAEHLEHWWGPKGFRLKVHQLDVRPGGKFHYSMTAENGDKMWGIFVYREVEAPERIVFSSSFSDENGNIVRAPFSKSFPVEVLNTWTFAEQDGKTRITLKGGPLNASEEERSFYTGMFSSMQQGFGATFDKLDEYLAKI